MILQGSFDFAQLATPYFLGEDGVRDRLVIVTARRDLSLQAIEPLAEHRGSDLVLHGDVILKALRSPITHYFGLLVPEPNLDDWWCPPKQFTAELRELRDAAKKIGKKLICTIHIGAEAWFSHNGTTYFDLYHRGNARTLGMDPAEYASTHGLELLPETMDKWEALPLTDAEEAWLDRVDPDAADG
jgi:hypothetical protein